MLCIKIAQVTFSVFLFVFSHIENRCTGSPTGDQGFPELQWDSHHTSFHGNRGRGARVGHGRRLFQALRSASSQWKAGVGTRGRSRNSL